MVDQSGRSLAILFLTEPLESDGGWVLHAGYISGGSWGRGDTCLWMRDGQSGVWQPTECGGGWEA
jgi:hypothetical protein